jgi:peptidoglycan/LPS O-acetylase OafA/YrhL
MIYYFVPIILFVNKEKHPKIVDAAIGYMCFILLTMGIVVCVYTKMVTSTFIFINIQTFVHHGTQIVLGVFIYVWNRKNITIKTFYRTLIAFGITAVIAILINLAFYPNFINMFFINPTRITNLPVGSIIQEHAGFAVYLIAFLSTIALATYLTYLVETSIYKLVKKKASAVTQ